ncbi:MAG: hypothetical protein E6J47_09040 [Chloroflexi bacterium]|nr:MAG: hypothetical protein E6J47_09040 [Chloroflexota bacterium]
MTDSLSWPDAADPGRRVGRAVEYHAAIGSTNDRARELLAEPDGEGVAVVADLQTAGRGRRGRVWVSPPGVNLMVSVAVRPAFGPDLASLLGLSVALALRASCSSVAPDAGLAIRWPNDLVDGLGRKVATRTDAARICRRRSVRPPRRCWSSRAPQSTARCSSAASWMRSATRFSPWSAAKARSPALARPRGWTGARSSWI